MGRTYIAKNQNAKGNLNGKNFDVNFAGADVLGILSKAAGCHSRRLERVDRATAAKIRIKFDPWMRPSTRFKVNRREAKCHAVRIMRLVWDAGDLDDPKSKSALKDAHQRCGRLFGGDVKAFKQFALEWAKFLETCGGYDVA